MARISRPPGFDMTYRPENRITFAPPIREMLPSLVYGAFALALTAIILYGQSAPSGSRLFYYVVEGDRHRLVSSSVCAIILAVSGLAALVREGMRGVIVTPNGIETREIVAAGWPRTRRLTWSQIDKLVVPTREQAEQRSKRIALDLWDGTRLFLPHVGRTLDLSIILERVALARAIPLEGGTGMVDDLESPLEA